MFNKYLVIMTLIIISGCNLESSDFGSEISDETLPVSDEVIASSESEISDETLPVSDEVIASSESEISDEILPVSDEVVSSSDSEVSDEILPVSDEIVSSSDSGVSNKILPVSGEVIPSSDSEISDEILPVSDEVIPSSESEGSFILPPETVAMSVENIHLVAPLTSVVQNKTIEIKTFATYSNQTQKDVSSEVNWFSSDKKIATINAHGELLGVSPGTVFITAEKGELVTKQFSVVVKTHLQICDSFKINNGSCLKVVQGQSGEAEHKIFTGSPSVNVMRLLGYEVNNTEDNRGKTYAQNFSESWAYTSLISGGMYIQTENVALFRQDGENWDDDPLSPDFGKNGQYDRFCRELSFIGFFDKNDWRRASKNEIASLVEGNGHLYNVYGWPTKKFYLTSSSTAQVETPRLIAVWGVLTIRHVPVLPSELAYISCVSETL
ncbi:Ig-like domain-containing protein [Photobacterium profundum]|uniref:BIG2 domain-containing protein n=1 Tax=Photobacterium profundum (strain SS9) TaxID=298386 RepID=Q6LSG8_PHOPR|nr:Ig-like domain-containing protein [Photobacterium profundum]CAG19758.1 hypothetical protein PBPRA1347 [Photobacterium profundum SS9]